MSNKLTRGVKIFKATYINIITLFRCFSLSTVSHPYFYPKTNWKKIGILFVKQNKQNEDNKMLLKMVYCHFTVIVTRLMEQINGAVTKSCHTRGSQRTLVLYISNLLSASLHLSGEVYALIIQHNAVISSYSFSFILYGNR